MATSLSCILSFFDLVNIPRTSSCNTARLTLLPLQAAGSPDPTQDDAGAVRDPAATVSAGHNLVVALISISNPSEGTGLADEHVALQSPASSTAFGGGYLSSGTWLAGAAERLNFHADPYRLFAGLGVRQINYTFFGIGDHSTSTGVPLEQKVGGDLLDFRRKFFSALHVGLRYNYAAVKTSLPGSDVAFVCQWPCSGACVRAY